MKTIYRYERDFIYYGFIDYKVRQPIIRLKEYNVVRETKLCFIIKPLGGKERAVLKHPIKKAFAYLDKKRALESFKKRTEMSLLNAERDVNVAKQFLELLKDI